MPLLAFHHVGLLTDQPALAAARLSRAGYSAEPPVFDPQQEATLQLCRASDGTATIELVTPALSNAALGRLLKRRGDYMYHVCFEAPTIEAGLDELRTDPDDRLMAVTPPRPAVLFGGRLVAFFTVPGLGLVELLQQKLPPT